MLDVDIISGIRSAFPADFKKKLKPIVLFLRWPRSKEFDGLQLNEYETDPYYSKPSYCFRISEDLHRFARSLQHLHSYAENFLQISCKSVQIFRNPETI